MKSQLRPLPIITKYEYFLDLASEANKITEQNFRQALKEILYNAYQNSNDSLGEDIVHAGLELVFHNNTNVQDHIVDVQTRRKNQKYAVLDRIVEVQYKIDFIHTKDVVKAVSILNEKGVLAAIEFVESIKMSY